jgi:hypothetical protein
MGIRTEVEGGGGLQRMKFSGKENATLPLYLLPCSPVLPSLRGGPPSLFCPFLSACVSSLRCVPPSVFLLEPNPKPPLPLSLARAVFPSSPQLTMGVVRFRTEVK